MNYSDFGEIIEDEFTGSVFGKDGHLTVLGWVEKQKDSYGSSKKIYLLKCSVCEKDYELFGDGVFRSSKSNLTAGRLPCGCAVKPSWSTAQWAIRLQRVLDSNHRFVKLINPEKGAFSKVEVICTAHGVWDTGNACNIISGQGCRLCANQSRVQNLRDHNSYSESKFIEKFYRLGGYPRDIVFTRVDKYFWSYTCNVCGDYCETRAIHLYKGAKSCSCTKFNPTQAYLNIILDGDLPIGLKFGVSKRARDRKFRWTDYNFHLYSIWEFDSRSACLLAEAECKNSLKTGIVSKTDMPEGFSETTYLYNLEEILRIYKNFGGKEIMRDLSNDFST